MTSRKHAQRACIAAALHFDDATAERALAIARVQETAAGETVIRQSDAGDRLFVVTKGRFEVDIVCDDATRAVRMLGPGSCFGEIAVLEGVPRTASVVSRTDGEVLVFPSAQVFGLLERDHDAWRRLFAESQERHAQLDRAAQRR